MIAKQNQVLDKQHVVIDKSPAILDGGNIITVVIALAQLLSEAILRLSETLIGQRKERKNNLDSNVVRSLLFIRRP